MLVPEAPREMLLFRATSIGIDRRRANPRMKAADPGSAKLHFVTLPPRRPKTAPTPAFQVNPAASKTDCRLAVVVGYKIASTNETAIANTVMSTTETKTSLKLLGMGLTEARLGVGFWRVTSSFGGADRDCELGSQDRCFGGGFCGSSASSVRIVPFGIRISPVSRFISASRPGNLKLSLIIATVFATTLLTAGASLSAMYSVPRCNLHEYVFSCSPKQARVTDNKKRKQIANRYRDL